MYWRVYIQVHVERPSFGRPWCLSTGEPVISFWDHVRWDDSLFIYTLWVSIKTSTFYFVNTLVKNQLIKVILVHRISNVETVYYNWKKYFYCILWNADHVSDHLAYVSSKFDESKIVGWFEWVVKKVDWVGLDPANLDHVHLWPSPRPPVLTPLTFIQHHGWLLQILHALWVKKTLCSCQ